MARNSSQSLRFEQLEHKRMLAGDVMVDVVDGVLVIEGDELGNQIAITSGANPGEWFLGQEDGDSGSEFFRWVSMRRNSLSGDGQARELLLLSLQQLSARCRGVLCGLGHLSRSGSDDACG